MEAIFILTCVALIFIFTRRKPRPLVVNALSKPARRLYTTVYGGGIADRPRVVPERETRIWVRSQPVRQLQQVRQYLYAEIARLQPADWDGYMLNAILAKSTDLFFFLDENGDLTIATARDHERDGIQDALQAVQRTVFHPPYTLRTLFHDMFYDIIRFCRKDDRYYGYGQLKVINLLRSYQASVGLCMLRSAANCDEEGPQPGVFARLALYFSRLQEKQERNRIDINRGYPVIEFDLRRIDQQGMFTHQGSLLNSLFLHLVSFVAGITDAEPLYRSFSESTYDMKAACFLHGYGEVYVVKYTGVNDEFPHRLYVEFANLTPRDPLYCELLSMKLHMECDN